MTDLRALAQAAMEPLRRDSTEEDFRRVEYAQYRLGKEGERILAMCDVIDAAKAWANDSAYGGPSDDALMAAIARLEEMR